ncbi:hypothetical protein B1R42_09830 [Trueperella pyogenes]|nr:hypothetical protein DBV13_09490 [Trueperella pyogenes]OQD32498.1 hypothetical protein B1R42_09830 [Trueperella pyogenes]
MRRCWPRIGLWCEWQLKIEQFRQLTIEHFVDDVECDSYTRLGKRSEFVPVMVRLMRRLLEIWEFRVILLLVW